MLIILYLTNWFFFLIFLITRWHNLALKEEFNLYFHFLYTFAEHVFIFEGLVWCIRIMTFFGRPCYLYCRSFVFVFSCGRVVLIFFFWLCIRVMYAPTEPNSKACIYWKIVRLYYLFCVSCCTIYLFGNLDIKNRLKQNTNTPYLWKIALTLSRVLNKNAKLRTLNYFIFISKL